MQRHKRGRKLPPRKQTKTVLANLQAEASKYGATVVFEAVTGSDHFKWRITMGRDSRLIITSQSPSDYRVLKQQRTEVRRLCNQLKQDDTP